MHYSRRERQRRLRNRILLAGGAIAVLAVGWWFLRRGPTPGDVMIADAQPAGSERVGRARPEPSTDQPPAPEPAVERKEIRLAADEEVIRPADSAAVPEPGTPGDGGRPQMAADASKPAPAAPSSADAAALARARQLHASGKAIDARHQLNALLSRQLSEEIAADARKMLGRIADETLFSQRQLPDDPLVDTYTVGTGDVLINIGKKYDVPAEVLIRINGISDPRRIRANQQLKVLRGPFHARIYKSGFRLDVYLGDLFVRSYPVGLGVNDGTPEGVWRVKERLQNPTYYPPASSPIKRIVAADDPENPLGEHWIGLEGIEGGAVGHEGYGIHGTIEPDSIGRAASLGCIRMRNEDVAELYSLLLPGHSKVTVLP